MSRAAKILALVGAGLFAAELFRRERIAAGQREPYIGIAEIARRLRARLGLFESAVTGLELRVPGDLGAPFDAGYFSGYPGSPAPAATLEVFARGDEPSVLVSPGGLGDTGIPGASNQPDGLGGVPTDFTIPNTAPEDFSIPQFAAARLSGESPAVRGVTKGLSGNLPGVVAAIIDGLIDAVAGRRGASEPGGRAAPSIGQAIVAAGRRAAGVLGIPSAIPGAALPGFVADLSVFLGRKGVEVEAARRGRADPTFEGRVELELQAQRDDPARFFKVLADPKNPPPEITFTTPRPNAPDPDALPSMPTPTGTPPGLPPGLPSAPGGEGETGTPSSAPATTGQGVPGGFTGEQGGTVATGGVPGLAAPPGFVGELSLGLSPAPPSPVSFDPSLVTEPTDPDAGVSGPAGVSGGPGVSGGAATGDGGVSAP